MTPRARSEAAVARSHTAGPLTKGEGGSAADAASSERADAVSAGLVKGSERYRAEGRKPKSAAARSKNQKQGRSAEDKLTDNASEQGGASLKSERASALQARRHLAAAIADAAAREADDTDELEGTQDVRSGASFAVRAGRSAKDALGSRTDGPAQDGEGARRSPIGKKGDGAPGKRPKKKASRIREAQRKRIWYLARAKAESGGHAATAAAGSAAKREGARGLAAAASSALGPLSGILCGVVCFVLCVLLISQAASALFGFWEDADAKRSLEGLPPYITYEMVEAALECQEEYGHPAGCTIAQIICESGMGDHLSALAERDKNLFGIKWASSYLGCPEVAGKSSWGTSEEYGGQTVSIMADFTCFKGHRECIVFRSRVLLANVRYAGNTLIQQAIAEKSSDKMAEGLKDAGYAISSDYVASLKSVMDAYGLRRFDGMSLEDFKSGAASGNAIVEAAHTQLGVPYVWGGTTPGVGLDCSGLTQFCYRQAGISIPRNSEDQARSGARVPLAEARPGDILWRPGHVAIYIGGDEYIHEPHSGDVCRKASGIAYFTCAIRYR